MLTSILTIIRDMLTKGQSSVKLVSTKVNHSNYPYSGDSQIRFSIHKLLSSSPNTHNNILKFHNDPTI